MQRAIAGACSAEIPAELSAWATTWGPVVVRVALATGFHAASFSTREASVSSIAAALALKDATSSFSTSGMTA